MSLRLSAGTATRCAFATADVTCATATSQPDGGTGNGTVTVAVWPPPLSVSTSGLASAQQAALWQAAAAAAAFYHAQHAGSRVLARGESDFRRVVTERDSESDTGSGTGDFGPCQWACQVLRLNLRFS